jgi:NAD-dependent dihydropyrimidine dehydrogenase PreA subunit
MLDNVIAFWQTDFISTCGSFWLWGSFSLVICAVAASLIARSSGLLFEFSIIALLWLIAGNDAPQHALILFLPLFIAFLYSLIPGRHALISVSVSVVLCVVCLGKVNLQETDGFGSIIVAAVFLMILFHAAATIRMKPGKSIRNLDLILCSYSGNTAHYARHFIDGVKARGAEVSEHRFHHYRNFEIELTGDALAITFPVIGWKPPWPFFNWLLFDLPRGNGKPAFVLYTCAGGPENTALVSWLLLTLKGYRVMGRQWGIYPVNIATARLGPKRLWKFLDRLIPFKSDCRAAYTAGIAFTEGKPAGLPFIFWPFPLFIFGILVDNKWLDRLISHNHVFKKRCTGCGLCVRYCPSARLFMKGQVPAHKGACVLCFGCVNLCPERAMHLWCMTEYGNRYLPIFPEGVVKE